MATGALAETVVEEVATNLEEVAQATRQIDPRLLSYVGVGLAAGFATGFYFGYKLARQRTKAEALREADEQIDQMREYYESKVTAAEPKPDLDQIVEERGYATDVDEEREPARMLRPPVPIVTVPPLVVSPQPGQRIVIEDGAADSQDPDWVWPQELASRTPNQPYIIHEDEYRANETDYAQTQYTYWAGDDVLTDTDNTPISQPNQVVGRQNLRFGHGAGDANIVFVRNDQLNLEIEIDREPGSYEEEVLGKTTSVEDGLEHSSQNRPARKKRRTQ
jgi:hypothetical protein